MSCATRQTSLGTGSHPRPSLVIRTRAPAADLCKRRLKLKSLAEARLQAAIKQYDETWAYYQQARIDSYQVYVWSKLILDCRRDMAEKPADRLAAFDDHLSRMKKLEALIKKVRRLGIRPLLRRRSVGILPPGGRILASSGESPSEFGPVIAGGAHNHDGCRWH